MKNNVFPAKLLAKLDMRKSTDSLRVLSYAVGEVDFSSNDYLGFAKDETLFCQAHQFLLDEGVLQNGSTGSRLISGNHPLFDKVEKIIAEFHQAESALVFNSGYDANLGFFSSVPQKGDVVLYDELCHASIRDGLQRSFAKTYKITHNDTEMLEEMIMKFRDVSDEIYVVTESVFSMDGDTPELEAWAHLCQKYQCRLVVDEAHALGVFGEKGEGLVKMLDIQDKVFARIMTFGKALGCHGAAIVGSEDLKQYLVNFARSFIYTTAMSPHGLASICVGYQRLIATNTDVMALREVVNVFCGMKKMFGLDYLFVRSKSAIQSAIIPGNTRAKEIANELRKLGFETKAILSPTVPEGQERLRICLKKGHTTQEMTNLLEYLSQLVFES